MKTTTLLSCAVLLLMCNSCEKEKEIELKPVLPVFEDGFNRTSLGEKWAAYYDLGDSVYLENNMLVIASPLWGSTPRIELALGEYNKSEFKLSMQFKLDNAAIATNSSIRLSTTSTFTTFWFELHKDSWTLNAGGNGNGGPTVTELKADEWYLLQVSVVENETQVNVIEMNTGSSIMTIKLQTFQSIIGEWNIASTAFNDPNGNTRKLYVDNFKIY
jgi:hypothetical protein